jgi:aminoglycoside 3-N-acetyltransferase I
MKDEISISVLHSSDIKDFKDLIDVFSQVFEMKNFSKPEPSHLQKVLDASGFFAFVAKKQGRVIGGFTVYVLEQYYSPRPLAYVYDLAVETDHQRQGVGKALIAYLKTYCQEKGFDEMFVQADKVDDYALDFYRSTSPDNEEETVTFSYLLR